VRRQSSTQRMPRPRNSDRAASRTPRQRPRVALCLAPAEEEAIASGSFRKNESTDLQRSRVVGREIRTFDLGIKSPSRLAAAKCRKRKPAAIGTLRLAMNCHELPLVEASRYAHGTRTWPNRPLAEWAGLKSLSGAGGAASAAASGSPGPTRRDPHLQVPVGSS
jgi:hypothetical protein